MRQIFILFIFCTTLFSADATIDIVKNIKSLPSIQVVAVDTNKQTIQVQKILLGDLKITENFNVFYDEKITGNISNNALMLDRLNLQGISLLAQISTSSSGGKLTARLNLIDTGSKAKLLEENFEVNEESLYPFLSHNIASTINEYIKAGEIKWMKQFVIFSKYTTSGMSEIVLADYTFTYKQPVITGGLNIFPKWANRNKTAFYYTNITSKASIYRFDLSTGENKLITSSSGMASVSSVSSDGKSLLLTLAPTGLSDIYLYNVTTDSLKRLTNYVGIDVSANFINNDSAMVFVSDRLGNPNIFIKNLDINAPISQLVYRGKNNNSISSFGNYVVYSSREGSNEYGLNTFNIYLMSTKTDYIRRLSASGTNLMPRFSHDGDAVMFLKSTNNESSVSVIRVFSNTSFLFPLKDIKIQSFDW